MSSKKANKKRAAPVDEDDSTKELRKQKQKIVDDWQERRAKKEEAAKMAKEEEGPKAKAAPKAKLDPAPAADKARESARKSQLASLGDAGQTVFKKHFVAMFGQEEEPSWLAALKKAPGSQISSTKTSVVKKKPAVRYFRKSKPYTSGIKDPDEDDEASDDDSDMKDGAEEGSDGEAAYNEKESGDKEKRKQKLALAKALTEARNGEKLLAIAKKAVGLLSEAVAEDAPNGKPVESGQRSERSSSPQGGKDGPGQAKKASAFHTHTHTTSRVWQSCLYCDKDADPAYFPPVSVCTSHGKQYKLLGAFGPCKHKIVCGGEDAQTIYLHGKASCPPCFKAGFGKGRCDACGEAREKAAAALVKQGQQCFFCDEAADPIQYELGERLVACTPHGKQYAAYGKIDECEYQRVCAGPKDRTLVLHGKRACPACYKAVQRAQAGPRVISDDELLGLAREARAKLAAADKARADLEAAEKAVVEHVGAKGQEKKEEVYTMRLKTDDEKAKEAKERSKGLYYFTEHARGEDEDRASDPPIQLSKTAEEAERAWWEDGGHDQWLDTLDPLDNTDDEDDPEDVAERKKERELRNEDPENMPIAVIREFMENEDIITRECKRPK